jgi:hypothetical protein
MTPVAPLDVADLVVSDSGLDAGYREILREHKVEPMLA